MCMWSVLCCQFSVLSPLHLVGSQVTVDYCEASGLALFRLQSGNTIYIIIHSVLTNL